MCNAPHHENGDKVSKLDCENIEENSTSQLTLPITSSVTSNTQALPDNEEEQPSCCRQFWQRVVAFYWANEFLILIILVILLARAYPPLGAIYLAPQITATWIAVVFVFLLAGLSLKTQEFANAFKQIYFNVAVQIFNFGVVSSVVFGVSQLLVRGNVISQGLASGMAVCGSLPMTINMVLVLTKAGGGDEAAAIFNAAFGNLVGVFLSPLLILGYLGVTGSIDLVSVFYKLALRVILPVAVGQILQKTAPVVVEFVKKHKPRVKQLQQYCLVFIVYTVFCRTFISGSQSSVGDIMLMIVFQFILLTLLMAIAWMTMRLLFRDQPRLRVMGLFGCTHKTVAMGIPLINAIFEGNPETGLYTLPLLIWHPMQLVIGSYLAPRLSAWVDRELERLGISEEEETGKGESSSDPAKDATGEEDDGAEEDEDKPEEREIHV